MAHGVPVFADVAAAGLYRPNQEVPHDAVLGRVLPLDPGHAHDLLPGPALLGDRPTGLPGQPPETAGVDLLDSAGGLELAVPG